MGLYNKANVRIFVQAGSLSVEEYELITGEAYA